MMENGWVHGALGALGAAQVQLAVAQVSQISGALTWAARSPRLVAEGTARWCSARLDWLVSPSPRRPVLAAGFASLSPTARRPPFAALSLGAAAPAASGSSNTEDEDESSRVLISEVRYRGYGGKCMAVQCSCAVAHTCRRTRLLPEHNRKPRGQHGS